MSIKAMTWRAALTVSATRALLLMLALLVTGASATSAQCRRRTDLCIQTQYDRARDVTTTILPPAPGTFATRIGAVFECPGKGSCEPTVVFLMVVRPVEVAKDTGPAEMTISVDLDEPLRFLTERAVQVDAATESTLEVYSWTMPVVEFIGLANAKSAGYTLGGRPLDIGSRHADALKAFAKRIPKSGV